MAGGRPLKFKSVAELQEKIDAYFADCDPHIEDVSEWVEARDSSGKLKKDENGLNYLVEVHHKVMTKQKPYTISGLALALDTSRETLMDYKEKAEYSDSLKAAKDKCQAYVETHLFGSGNVTGVIFNLKNNYNWKDKTEQEHSIKYTKPFDEVEDGLLKDNRLPEDQEA